MSPDHDVDVSVVIVSYRTPDLIGRCLESLRTATTDLTLEVVVVDNASGDGSAALIAREHPDVTVVTSRDNVGFGRAVNRGARVTRGRFLLLLNPDTVVLPGAVEALVACADRAPEAGLVGGRTLTVDGETEPTSCLGAPTLWSMVCFASGLSTVFRRSPAWNPETMPGWDRDDEREVGVVTGCVLLVARTVWDRLGGFDPDYFMYGEDTDLSMRARALGYRPRITPAAEVVHTLGASSSSSVDRWIMVLRGRATVVRKRFPPLVAPVAVRLLVAGVWLRACLAGSALSGSTMAVSPAHWAGAWERRDEWRTGYPPHSERAEVRSGA